MSSCDGAQRAGFQKDGFHQDGFQKTPAWGVDATGLTEAEVAARANQGMPEGDRLLECCACGTDRG